MPASPETRTGRRPSALRVVRQLLAAFRGHSFATDGAWVVATQIVGKGSGTIMLLLLARFLSVRDFASFTYLFTTATLLSTYVAAGLPLTISRVVAEGRDDRSWPDDDRLGAVLLVTAAATLGVLVLAPLYLPWLLSDEVPVSGSLIVVAGLAITWVGLAQAGLYGSGRFREAFLPVVAGTMLLFASAAAAVLLQNIVILIAGNIAGMLVSAAAYTRHLFRQRVLVPRHWLQWPRRRSVREVLATTLPGLGFSVIYASTNWLLARTLVERQATPDQFNQYMIGLQWFSLVLFVPLAFGQVLFPKFVQKARSSALTVTQIVLPAALTFATVLACALVGTALTPLVSWLYGGQYQFARLFVFTILLAAALSGAVNILGSFVMAARGMAAWLLVNMASAVVAVLLLWSLPLDTAFEAARTLCLIQLTPLAIATVLVVRHREKHPLTHASREEVVALPAAAPLNE